MNYLRLTLRQSRSPKSLFSALLATHCFFGSPAAVCLTILSHQEASAAIPLPKRDNSTFGFATPTKMKTDFK